MKVDLISFVKLPTKLNLAGGSFHNMIVNQLITHVTRVMSQYNIQISIFHHQLNIHHGNMD